MARIPYFDPETAPENVVRAMAGKRQINVFKMIANSNNAAPEVLALGHQLSRGSSLDVVEREVVILRVAHLSGASYQWHEHTRVALRVGLSQEKIDAVAAYSAVDPGTSFSEFERSLLDFTDAVVATTTAPDVVFDRVAERYDHSKLVELVLLIGFYMMVGRVMNTFDIELETGAVESYRLRLE